MLRPSVRRTKPRARSHSPPSPESTTTTGWQRPALPMNDACAGAALPLPRPPPWLHRALPAATWAGDTPRAANARGTARPSARAPLLELITSPLSLSLSRDPGVSAIKCGVGAAVDDRCCWSGPVRSGVSGVGERGQGSLRCSWPWRSGRRSSHVWWQEFQVRVGQSVGPGLCRVGMVNRESKGSIASHRMVSNLAMVDVTVSL